MPPSIEHFWALAEERERIRQRKADGQPWPWTEDPIFRDYHFCNVRRADDRGTVYYLEQVVAASQDDEDLLWRTVLYRIVNNALWFDSIGGVFSADTWANTRGDIMACLLAVGPPHSKAHIVLSGGGRSGRSKRTVFVDALDANTLLLPAVAAAVAATTSLEVIWKQLMRFAGVGEFISVQVYEDLFLAGGLRHVDENSFVRPGPGAMRGMELLTGRSLTLPYPISRPGKPKYSVGALQEMSGFLRQELYEKQPVGLCLTIGDVQGWLCESRKYWDIENPPSANHRVRRYYPKGAA